jgi:hypothetical protein
MKGDGVWIDDLDLTHRRKERLTRHADAFGRPDDARKGGVDILGGEIGAVVEFDALTQVKRVRFAVGRDVPAMGQIGDNALTVTWVAADQIVVHGPLGSHVGHCSRLVNVEVGRCAVHSVPQRSSGLGVGFRGLEPKIRPGGIGRLGLCMRELRGEDQAAGGNPERL